MTYPASGHRSLGPNEGINYLQGGSGDTDRDNGLPDVSRYEGPMVADQPALVNPSAGTQGPVEQGMTDINPQGPAPRPGAGPASYQQAPQDTSKGYPN